MQDRFVLENPKVRVEASERGRLLAVGAPEDACRFEVGGQEQLEGGPLWQIVFRDQRGESCIVEPPDTCAVAAGDENARESLRLQWDTVVRDEPLSVTMTVSLAEDEAFTRWRTAVDYSGPLSVWEVSGPRLCDLGKIGGDGSEDLLVCPKGTGFMVRNPVAVLNERDVPVFGPADEYNALDGETPADAFDTRIASSYPGMWAMQFLTFSNPEIGGLYFGAYDGEGRYKRFGAYGRKGIEGIEIAMRHYPDERMSPGLSYRTPYDTVLGVCGGQWWDGALIYREWALEQVWCQKGPLSKRQDIPQWVLDADLWYWNWRSKPRLGGGRGCVEDVVPAVVDLRERLGVDMAVHWYECNEEPFNRRCPELFPTLPGVSERLREGVAELHRHGIHATPYLNARLWDCHLPSWEAENAEAAVTRQPDGSRGDLWDVRDFGQWYAMCPTTMMWQDKVIGMCRQIQDEWDMDGAYLDQITSCYVVPCFADNHGHPRGGGNTWYAGYRTMMERLREAIMPDYPEAAYTSESVIECWLDLFDTDLAREASKLDRTMEAIPVFHCLYHDYALSYGTVHQLGGEHPGAYTYGEALILNSGQALMVENYYKEDIGTDRFSRELEYLRRLCQARKRAHKWLTFGRWLPPVDLATDIVRVTFGPSPEDTMRVPAVLTSSWGLEDGSVCILLINHTGHPRRASYTIPTETYGLAAESVEVAELGEDGEKPVDCADGHSALDRVDVVPRWSVRVLVLRPAGRR